MSEHDLIAKRAHALDAADPLRDYRKAFALPKGVIYLDGNSLGALPKATGPAMQQVIEREWGAGLIGSWNDAGWFEMGARIGGKIAGLIGAEADEVIACDTVSINLFKLIAAALHMRLERKVVLSEPGNFPTDLYMIEGLRRQGLAEPRLAPREALIEAIDEDVALVLLTHAHYKTGAVHDMAAITKAAHDKGALVLWDLSHSTGALDIDLNAAGADFATGCGYKYLCGGPGAPAFAYVAKRHHAGLAQPLTGWFGHARPFAFSDEYEAAPGIEQLQCGTSPVLGLAALEIGVDLIADIGPARLEAKSIAQRAFFLEALEANGCALECVSPMPKGPEQERGASHLSFRHGDAFAISQALIARGVIGDFRDPDILRLGFAPAYLSFADIAAAAAHLAQVIKAEEWCEFANGPRAAVT